MIIVDGAKIKDLRLKNDLILDEFARAVGTTAGMLHQVETGNKQPGVSLLKRIAIYFELTADDLIIEVNSPPGSNE